MDESVAQVAALLRQLSPNMTTVMHECLHAKHYPAVMFGLNCYNDTGNRKINRLLQASNSVMISIVWIEGGTVTLGLTGKVGVS